VSGDPHQATIRVQTLGGGWETLGADRYRSIVPEGLVCSANRWGPDTCAFSLRRDVSPLGPDISTWTPVEIEVAGVVVWDGRIRATPTSEADGPIISVQGQGWQYHLDDDVYDRTYVHARLGDWRDYRSFPTAYLPESPVAGTVNAGDGRVVMGWANGAVVTTTTGVAITLDLGPGSVGAKRVVVTGDFTGLGGFFQLYCRGHNALDSTGGFAFSGLNDAFIVTPTAVATYSGTFSANFRYVTLICWYPGTTTTTTTERTMSLTSVQTFTDTAYESGNASILKLDQVANDALTQATLLLSADRSEIKPGTFSIPEWVVTDSTPRSSIATANGFENFETKMLIGRRLAVRPRASTPIYEIGAWAGSEFQDASAGSGDDIVNRFIVRGTGPDGGVVKVERSTAGPLFDVGASPQFPNATFATDASSWTTGGAGTSLTRDTTTFDTAAASGAFGNPGYPDTAGIAYTQLTGLTPRVGYRVTIMMRLATGFGGSFLNLGIYPDLASVGLAFDSGRIGPFIGTPVTGAFTAMTADFTAPASGSVYLYMRWNAGANPPGTGTTFWVDSITSARSVFTLADRRGFFHTRTTTAGAAITTAVGRRIADLYLQAHASAPFSGSFTAVPGGVRRVDSGAEPHPAWLLLDTGQLVRCVDRVDPDTGAWGRAGEIDTVTYTADALSSEVALNENRAGLDALLARYQVVAGARA
jgi:hypothetical protein